MTKYFLTSIIASSTVTSLLTLKPFTHIQIVPHLLHQWQWWRIPVWMASYSNAGEVLFACLAVYNLRALERLFGSRKYAVSSSRISRLILVLPNILIHHQFNPSTIGIRINTTSSLIKSTQLPPSRTNPPNLLHSPSVHSPHPPILHPPSRRQHPHPLFPNRHSPNR